MAVGAAQQILAGKYRLERELGRGGMGAVWLAQHLTLRSPVAIKLIDPEIATSHDVLSRFLREAQAAAALRSPHVVQILDHGVDDGVPFIVMELLEGESLAARLQRLHQLSPADTAHLLTQIARAMTRAHEAGIVHRDLKPDNIFIVHNDEDEVAKVLDFGVAKSLTPALGSVSSATRTGSVLGTPYYMSPEQAEGAKSVDHRTDIWAMGVIAWECLLGARPFEAETLGSLILAICAREVPVPSRVGPVPPGFDAWFARACSRDLSHRFGSAKEAALELRELCAGQPMAGSYRAAVQPGERVAQAASLQLASTTAHLSVSTSSPTPKRSATAWIVSGLLVCALLAGGAFLAFAGGEHGEGTTSSAVSPQGASPTLPPELRAPAAAASDGAPAAAASDSAPAPAAKDSAPAAPAKDSAPAAAASDSATPPRSTASATVAAVAKRAPSVKHRPASLDKPKPATPAAAASPASKPRINLGI